MLNWNIRLLLLLGQHIQTDLVWKEHITSVAKNLSSKIGIFLRLSKFLKFDILCKLYFALVVPHLETIITWGNSSSSNTDSLQKLQNRLTRIITKNYNYQIRGLDIVKHLGWMNV